ncbi:MAG: cyclic nucleotide-binding domain-containing protein [Rudaea sp.]
MSSKDPFVEIGAGKPVFSLGETGTEMFLIESGQVELSAGGVRALLGPGDFFGEDFLLDGRPRTESATVVEAARLMRLSRNTLAEVIAENPEIALGLMRRLLERARDQASSTRSAQAAPAATPVAPPIVEAPAAVPEAVQPAPPPRVAPAPVPPAPAAPAPAPPPATPPPPPLPAAPLSFALRHIATGQLLPLEQGRAEFLVGRPDLANGIDPEVDLGPYDQNRSLSRRHAKIVMRDGVYFVREDSSTPNGTYVHDERIATGVDVPLKPGDRLRFGTIEVELMAV